MAVVITRELIDAGAAAPSVAMLDSLERDVDWQAVRAQLAPLEEVVESEAAGTLFRMLLVARLADLDDGALAEVVADRLSLRHFCGLAADDAVPDPGTVARFRALLAATGGERLIERIAAGGQVSPLI